MNLKYDIYKLKKERNSIDNNNLQKINNLQNQIKLKNKQKDFSIKEKDELVNIVIQPSVSKPKKYSYKSYI